MQPKTEKAQSRRPKQTVNTLKKQQTIKRHIHYYELLLGFRKAYFDDQKKSLIHLLRTVTQENDQRGAGRFFVYGDKTFCVQGLTIRENEELAFGKLCTIRTEDFPMMFNMRNDSTRDLDAEEFEGIVEFSHFVINYKPHPVRIAFEFNQYGAKIQDLARYFSHVGTNHSITEGAGFKHIVNGDLQALKKKIGRISKFTAKISRSNIDTIKKMDTGLASALPMAADHFSMQDVLVELKFDYRHANAQNAVSDMINNLINRLSKNPLQADLFLKLSVEAENLERDNIINAFDLLLDKIRSEIRATKDGKNRTVVSNELLQNMIVEMKKMNL